MKIITVISLLLASQFALATELFKQTTATLELNLQTTEKAAITAQVNTELLRSGEPQFEISLASGEKITAVFDSLKQNKIKGYSWKGHINGDASQKILFSLYKDSIAGSIHTLDKTYEISPLGNNQVKLSELDPHAFPACDGGVDAPAFTKQVKVADNRPLGTTLTVDVIVVYTPEAQTGAGGENQIMATAQAAVDAMNSSLNNSLIDTEIVLLYAGLVNYNDTGNSSTDLNWLRNSTEVAGIRSNYGADMAALLVESMGGCGRGYVMRNPGPGFANSAVQVTRRSCAVGNLSFAHEFGHNMGLEHNPEDSSASPASASYAWSFGHYHNASYRTVMSYSAQCPNGCTRRQYFSNPDVDFNALPTGIADERDNARSLRLTSPIVSDFRLRVVDPIYMNGFE